jgi:hypothetical protein
MCLDIYCSDMKKNNNEKSNIKKCSRAHFHVDSFVQLFFRHREIVERQVGYSIWSENVQSFA